MITIEEKNTQIEAIDAYMEDHPEGITMYEAFLELEITKLSTRVSEMLRRGYKIEKTPEVKRNKQGKIVKRYMRYRKAV